MHVYCPSGEPGGYDLIGYSDGFIYGNDTSLVTNTRPKSDCDEPEWDPQAQYTGGDVVKQSNALWVCLHGQDNACKANGEPGPNQAWKQLWSCNEIDAALDTKDRLGLAYDSENFAIARPGFARSYNHDDNSTGYIETTVHLDEPSEVHFLWTVDSQPYQDRLSFRVDGALMASISGQQDWSDYHTGLSAGSHTLRWEYVKNAAGSVGDDRGGIDQLRFVPQSWTCNDAYYGTNDGCDCACGSKDPDCIYAGRQSCEFASSIGACTQNTDYDVYYAKNWLCEKDCTFVEWDSSTVYHGGDRVIADGEEYEAQFWNQGTDPRQNHGGPGSGQPWGEPTQCKPCVPQCDGRECGGDGCGGSCGDCGTGQSCTPDGQCEDHPTCTAPVWNAQTVYYGGDDVTHGNNEYTAQYWTQNQGPDTNNGGPGSGQPWGEPRPCLP